MENYGKMYEGLSDEMKKKAAACKTPEELLALTRSEGFELSEEQLQALSGGYDWGCNCNMDDPDDPADPNNWA